MLHAFVCTSVYSRHAFVYPCWNETTETTIEALEAAWAFFGGVFAGIVPDNLKAVVTKADPVNPVFNQEFREYATARNFDIGPARVRKPQDKGRVENNIKYTQGDLFAGETLTTLAQWRAEALRWCREVAGQRTHGTTFRRPLEHFELEEKAALSPAPTTTWEVGRWVEAKVGRDRRIRVANAWYRVDGVGIGELVRVRVGRTTLRVFNGREILGAFPRVEPGQTGGAARAPKSVPEATAGRDAALFHSIAAGYGPHVSQTVARLLGRGMWFSQVRKVYHLFDLCKRYGGAAADDACGKLLAADGDASTPALTKPAANDGADGAAAPVVETVALAGPPSPSPPPSCEVDEAAAKTASTKLTWAQALQRAFGWDLLQCPCGGRRKMIAAIRNPAQVEKILRHVGQWREAGDRDGADGDDVIAIRGPPGTFDDNMDEAPGEKFDGVDEPVQMDWAA